MRSVVALIAGLCLAPDVPSAQADTVSECLNPKDTGSIAQCARRSCERAVRAALPLPTTARFPSIASRAGVPEEGKTEVRVEGKVEYQVDVNRFVVSSFHCLVTDNVVVELHVELP